MDLKAAMQAISGGASPKMASIIINAMKMTEAANGERILVIILVTLVCLMNCCIQKGLGFAACCVSVAADSIDLEIAAPRGLRQQKTLPLSRVQCKLVCLCMGDADGIFKFCMCRATPVTSCRLSLAEQHLKPAKHQSRCDRAVTGLHQPFCVRQQWLSFCLKAVTCCIAFATHCYCWCALAAPLCS
jgi:hypothetical protein